MSENNSYFALPAEIYARSEPSNLAVDASISADPVTMNLSDFTNQYFQPLRAHAHLRNIGPDELEGLIPYHSHLYSTHSIYAQWAIALASLPDILGINLQDAFDSLPLETRITCFMIFAYKTPDVSIELESDDLSLSATPENIMRIIRQETPHFDSVPYYFKYICDHYSCFLDACLKKWEEHPDKKDLSGQDIDALLDMAAQANTEYTHIERFFAKHSSALETSAAMLDHIVSQASAYFDVDSKTLEMRKNILKSLALIASRYSEDVTKDSYKAFMDVAHTYLQFYIEERCKDLGIPSVKLVIQEANANASLAAMRMCSHPHLRFLPHENELIIYGADTSVYKVRNKNLLVDTLNTIEHELFHAQSKIILLRTNDVVYSMLPEETVKQYPRLMLSDPLVQIFMPLWRNTDHHGYLMNGRYFSSSQNPKYFNHLAIGLDKQDPEYKIEVAKALMSNLYQWQLEEKVARLSGDIAGMILFKALKDPKPQNKTVIAPRPFN